MKELIDQKTREAIRHYGDSATERFYQHLRERQLKSTRCERCHVVAFPPRSFCPSCHAEDVEWVDLPKQGTLYAFTTQDRSLRFPAPDVLGLVEFEGVGRILSHVRGRYEDLAIGDRVTLDFVEVSSDLVLHCFEKL
jgi:uncharacterized OB-fold protein